MIQQQWALGMLWLQMIPNRRAATLLPIIQLHAPYGSIIITDEFASYEAVQSLGYNHFTVNHSAGDYSHSDNDSEGNEISVTTNHIESVFGQLRGRTRNNRTRNIERLDAVLCELMFESQDHTIFELFQV